VRRSPASAGAASRAARRGATRRRWTRCLEVEAELGSVDILVNNLGSTQVLPFALIDLEDWDSMMAVNLRSLFLFSKRWRAG